MQPEAVGKFSSLRWPRYTCNESSCRVAKTRDGHWPVESGKRESTLMAISMKIKVESATIVGRETWRVTRALIGHHHKDINCQCPELVRNSVGLNQPAVEEYIIFMFGASTGRWDGVISIIIDWQLDMRVRLCCWPCCYSQQNGQPVVYWDSHRYSIHWYVEKPN